MLPEPGEDEVGDSLVRSGGSQLTLVALGRRDFIERDCKANFYKNLQLAGGLIAAQVDISRVGAEFAGGRRGWGRSAPEEPIQGVDGISNIDPVITI